VKGLGFGLKRILRVYWTQVDCEGYVRVAAPIRGCVGHKVIVKVYVRVAAPIRGCVGHKVIVKGKLGLRRQLKGVLDTR
jgi:hypothetical protein